MRDVNRMRDRVELSLDNRQVVSFVIGSLVVLGVVFALGVLVGKQLTGGDASAPASADPLAALDAKEAPRRPPPAEGAAEPTPAPRPDGGPARAEAGPSPSSAPAARPDAGGGRQEKLTFAEALTRPSGTEAAVDARKPEPKRPDDRPRPAPEPEKHKSGLAAAFEKASKPAGDGYSLQVTSLPSRPEAEEVAQKLAAKGFASSIVPADVPGKGRFYRVRVGPYATRGEAEEAARAIKQKLAMTALVSANR